jgi:hypothetical protein
VDLNVYRMIISIFNQPAQCKTHQTLRFNPLLGQRLAPEAGERQEIVDQLAHLLGVLSYQT